ncbi:MAG: alpha-amylase family glycosyl hydrolase [Oscillospiraceae bacterium]
MDPVLGDENDFVNLCKVAKENDVKIVLDGVFSHTGSESVYFNKSKFYGEGGAFNDVNSVYRSWYDFSPNYPCGYRSWWGFESLPEVNEDDPAFQNFICGEGGVIEKWLNLGADGFRLDVADELPDDFIEQIRKTVKRCGDEKLLIGEVWEDATNKWSYGARRTYLLGEGLDSVMNYPFRNAVIQFIKYGDAIGAMDSIFDICENYPKPSLDTAMNFLSTHDTERIITTLAGEDAEGRDRYWQSGRLLSDEKYEVGKQLLRLGFAFMFFLPGNPCVYYGDEIAMEGYKDPFNRGYFNWDETDDRLINTIRALSRMREQNPVFKEGRLSIIRAEKDILCLKRSDETGEAVIAINRTRHNIVLDMLDETVTVTPYSFAIRSAIK